VVAPNQLPVSLNDLPDAILQLDMDLGDALARCTPIVTSDGEQALDYKACVKLRPELKALRARFEAFDRPATKAEVAHAVSNRYIKELPLAENQDEVAVTRTLCRLLLEHKITPYALHRVCDDLFFKGKFFTSTELPKAISRQQHKRYRYREMFELAEVKEALDDQSLGAWVRPDSDGGDYE
jgi:hypothetical protein